MSRPGKSPGSGRERRLELILQIVRERAVATQAELVEALRERGMDVSQSSVSRDVKELGLVKVPTGDGGYRYGTSSPGRRPRGDVPGVVAELVDGVATGSGLVALRTPPGAADRVAIALDESGPDEVVATVAGDDTVLVLVEDAAAAGRLRRRLESWME